MPISLALERVKISDGSWLQCRSGLTVLVGPNNSGKSQFLRDVVAQLRNPDEPGVVVNEVVVHREGDIAAFREWVHENTRQAPGVLPPSFQRHATSLNENQINVYWQGPAMEALVDWLVLHAAAEQRLGLANAVGSIDPVSEVPTSLLHFLYTDASKEARLRAASHEAFGTDVTVNRFAGQRVHLHWGSTDLEPQLPTNADYIAALHALPQVQIQGDGVRSFLGLMLALISATYEIVLVDEPEAFLHPPQARLLGDKLAGEAPASAQIIVATHSADVLRGLLQDPGREVRVVRLIRDGDQNHASALEPDRVRELWADPLLRYSAALDGLFHSGVVVCESDADCRFYQATLDAALEREGERPHDLLFTYCGGKHRMPQLVEALHAVGVPVRVIADLDVLREVELTRRLVEGLGGPWDTNAEADWRAVNAAVEQTHGPNPPLADIQQKIVELFDGSGETRLTRPLREAVRELTKAEDGWSRVKQFGGSAAIPPGQASQAVTRLLDLLDAAGVFLVRPGELEDWDRQIPGHGPGWVAAALDAGVHSRPGPHADFVLSMARSI